MGASGWSYFVPYQPDINQALQELRQRIFEAASYYQMWQPPDQQRAAWARLLARDPEYAQTLAEAYNDQYGEPPPSQADLIESLLRGSGREQPPQTIEDLIKYNGEAGTHSILDIQRVVDSTHTVMTLAPGEPERFVEATTFGAVSPLSDSQLVEIFGTIQPTHELVEQWDQTDGYSQYCGRWSGIYLIVYNDGSPDEIYFAGFSGD